MQGVRIRSECDDKKNCVELSELPQIKGVGSRERLLVHRALAASLSLVPSTKVRSLTRPLSPAPRDLIPPLAFKGTCTHLHSPHIRLPF